MTLAHVSLSLVLDGLPCRMHVAEFKAKLHVEIKCSNVDLLPFLLLRSVYVVYQENHESMSIACTSTFYCRCYFGSSCVVSLFRNLGPVGCVSYQKCNASKHER